MDNDKLKAISEILDWWESNKTAPETIVKPEVLQEEIMTSGYVQVGPLQTTEGTITTTTSDGTTDTTWVITDNVSSAEDIPEVVVKSLSDQPEIKVVPLVESEDNDNIWYVDDYESIEGTCSTSKVMYKDSTLLMNVCESEGITKVNLILEIDGKIEHVPFRLEKACQNCEDHDMIVSL